jgi:hypothetical protein
VVTLGARGPLPKPNPTRRNATIAMTQLPAEGRQGNPPAWPLIPDVATTVRRDLAVAKAEQLQADRSDLEAQGKPTGAIERRIDQALMAAEIAERQLAAAAGLEAALWADMWRTPMAVQWEVLGWTRDVAQYVRHKVLGELGELDHAKEARAWSNALGLNPSALQRLRWQVAPDEVGAARKARTAPARPRLVAVEQ